MFTLRLTTAVENATYISLKQTTTLHSNGDISESSKHSKFLCSRIHFNIIDCQQGEPHLTEGYCRDNYTSKKSQSAQ